MAVSAPTPATTVMEMGARTNMVLHRATMKTPAVTMVAAWIKADTGVGPSMASGSQVYSGIWADLPVAPKNRNRVMAVRTPEPMGYLAARGNTSEKFNDPKVQKIRKTPNRKPKSPIRLTTKAFLPASDADCFSYQNPMSR